MTQQSSGTNSKRAALPFPHKPTVFTVQVEKPNPDGYPCSYFGQVKLDCVLNHDTGKPRWLESRWVINDHANLERLRVYPSVPESVSRLYKAAFQLKLLLGNPEVPYLISDAVSDWDDYKKEFGLGQ